MIEVLDTEIKQTSTIEDINEDDNMCKKEFKFKYTKCNNLAGDDEKLNHCKDSKIFDNNNFLVQQKK